MPTKPTYQELEQKIKVLEQAEIALQDDNGKYKGLYEESRRSEELYRSFLDSSPDAIVIYDLEGKTCYINPAFTRSFGWTKEDVRGKPIPMIPESEKERTMAMVHALIREGLSYQGFETKRFTKDGRLREVSISASGVDDQHGRISGILVILRDISEKKALEAQLTHAHKMEAIGTLAGGIAHDFNNILQAISGYTQILLMSKSPEDPEYSKLKAIDRSSQKASELTKQLLVFSRKVQSELRQVDLNHSVRAVSELLKRTIPKMISIELKLDEDLRAINADPVQIEQIIMNLGVNARDAMPEGGKLVIETSNIRLDERYCKTHVGAKMGQYVLMRITDTGFGMDEETLNHIFEPFFTTKDVGKGTGLGLAMVYGIVNNHGGYVTCSTQPGIGTTFDVYFPVLSMEKVERVEEEKADQQVARGSERILLVDDEQTVLEVVQDILDRFGYHTLTAASGEEAIEIYRQKGHDIDMVILDLNMPGMGGHKCLKELLWIDPGAKVIIASGYSDNKRVQETLQAGAAGFISKPYKYKDILKKIRGVFETGS
ncbi:MAG: hybrid sensor histidine kinase/response regulator [Desulfatiglandales bacterium]